MMTNTTAPAPTCPFWIRALPRVIGLWLLAGAVFKLQWGTPAHLPAVVKSLPLGVQLTYQLVISIEFVLIVLAFLRPRWAWFLLAGCLATFCAILISQIASGVTDCGCFGANFSPDPRVMLGIDATLLVLLLISKPWANLPTRGANVVAVVALCVALVALTFQHTGSREVKHPDAPPRTPVAGATDGTDGQTTSVSNGQEQPSTEPAVAQPQPTNAYLILDPRELKGKHIDDTPFARYIDVYSLPYDGLWVIYRNSCEHCAEHLIDMTQTEMGTRMIGLVRLPDDSEQTQVVHVLPQGPHVMTVEMPVMDYVITTPAELLVENGIIIDAKEGVEPGKGL